MVCKTCEALEIALGSLQTHIFFLPLGLTLAEKTDRNANNNQIVLCPSAHLTCPQLTLEPGLPRSPGREGGGEGADKRPVGARDPTDRRSWTWQAYRSFPTVTPQGGSCVVCVESKDAKGVHKGCGPSWGLSKLGNGKGARKEDMRGKGGGP